MPQRTTVRLADRLAIIAATVAGAIRALAYVRLKVRIIVLRIMAEQASFDAA